MSDQLKFYRQPDLQGASLILGWSADASRLGAKVTDYLVKKLGGEYFAEIEPVEFFHLGGISIEENIIKFPQSEFYFCPNKNLVVFKSDSPAFRWHKFLNLILDAAGRCHARDIYTVGGMVSFNAHTSPRELIGTFNTIELKENLSAYNLKIDWDYETPPGQRPTLNAFLLWEAKRRNIPGAGLWVPVPFYLLASDDPSAQKKVLEFFNQRFNLEMDLSDLDDGIRLQNQMLTELRSSFPDIDEAIKRLESRQPLSDDENQKLVQEVEKFLREKQS